MSSQIPLEQVLREVATTCREIDTFIQSTKYNNERPRDTAIFPIRPGASPFDLIETVFWGRNPRDVPLEPGDKCIVYYWERYFEHMMDEWDGDRLSAMKFNSTIERLSISAAKLDQLIPVLENQCSRNAIKPKGSIQHVFEMQGSVNAFLNSAEMGLEIWLKQEGLQNTNGTLRQRRPQQPSKTREIRPVEQNDNLSTDLQYHASQRFKRARDSLLNLLLSHSALLAITCTISLLSCGLEVKAYILSTEPSQNNNGTINDADFFTAIQNLLIQNTSLYATMVPALKTGSLRRQYPLWAWLFALSSFIVNCVAIGIYTTNTALNSLLNCVASILQMFVTLQVVFFASEEVEEVVGLGHTKEEHQA